METARPDATDRAPADRAPARSGGVLRFALTIGAWFVGLFGLMRLGWVEHTLLTPFAQLQQRVGGAAYRGDVGPALRRRELQRRRPHGPLHGRDLRVPRRVGLAAARRRAGARRDYRAERGAARFAVDGGREPGPARRPAPLRVARHPDSRRRRLRLRLDGPAGERSRPAARGGGRGGRGRARRPRAGAAARRGDPPVPGADGGARRGVLRGRALLLPEQPRARARRVGRADRRGHSDRRRHRDHRHRRRSPHRARRFPRHPGVRLHAAHPGVPGRRAGRAARAVAPRPGPCRRPRHLLGHRRPPASSCSRRRPPSSATTRWPSTASRRPSSPCCSSPRPRCGPPATAGRVPRAPSWRWAWVSPRASPPPPCSAPCSAAARPACRPSPATATRSSTSKGRPRCCPRSRSASSPPSGPPSPAAPSGAGPLLGLGILAAAQVVLALPVGELAFHVGFNPHVSLIRAWTVVVPLVLVWFLARPEGAAVWRASATPVPVSG